MMPMYISMFLAALNIIIMTPLHYLLAFQQERYGMNQFKKVNTLNYLMFSLNVFSIWLIIRNHELSYTKITARVV